MKIALDYDETFTADKETFTAIVKMFKSAGHDVRFVTYRGDEWVGDNVDIEADALKLGIDIIYTSGKQKQHCYDADIWIDDQPVTIPQYEDLKNMAHGCEVNNDYDDI